jgi:hypothetical protein
MDVRAEWHVVERLRTRNEVGAGRHGPTPGGLRGEGALSQPEGPAAAAP